MAPIPNQQTNTIPKWLPIVIVSVAVCLILIGALAVLADKRGCLCRRSKNNPDANTAQEARAEQSRVFEARHLEEVRAWNNFKLNNPEPREEQLHMENIALPPPTLQPKPKLKGQELPREQLHLEKQGLPLPTLHQKPKTRRKRQVQEMPERNYKRKDRYAHGWRFWYYG